MYRLRIFLITFLVMMLFIGCNSKENTEKASFTAKQQKAIESSVNFIKSSSFTSKEQINIKVLKIQNATETTWEHVWTKDSKLDKNIVDSTDWIITIGNTSGHDFANIVCDSDTSEVIGYIPID